MEREDGMSERAVPKMRELIAAELSNRLFQ